MVFKKLRKRKSLGRGPVLLCFQLVNVRCKKIFVPPTSWIILPNIPLHSLLNELKISNYLFILFMGICVYVPVYMYVCHGCAVQVDPLELELQQFWFRVWMLRIDPKSSKRAVSIRKLRHPSTPTNSVLKFWKWKVDKRPNSFSPTPYPLNGYPMKYTKNWVAYPRLILNTIGL